MKENMKENQKICLTKVSNNLKATKFNIIITDLNSIITNKKQTIVYKSPRDFYKIKFHKKNHLYFLQMTQKMIEFNFRITKNSNRTLASILKRWENIK